MRFPSLGFGLGLRGPHLEDILAGNSRADWFEALTENYLGLPGHGAGQPLQDLLKVRELKPVVLHGVSLSIGGTDELDRDYLARVKQLMSIIEPTWVSDHLCWTGVHGFNTHDLLPLPLNEETLSLVAARVQRVQEFWQRPLILENVSSYVTFPETTMSEAEFLNALARRTGCGLLLDVNNIYVSSRNHGFDPRRELEKYDFNSVAQIHLAGHIEQDGLVIDTHSRPVRSDVWDLYALAVQALPTTATMIEWDDDIPPLDQVENELFKAKAIHEELSRDSAEALL